MFESIVDQCLSLSLLPCIFPFWSQSLLLSESIIIIEHLRTKVTLQMPPHSESKGWNIDFISHFLFLKHFPACYFIAHTYQLWRSPKKKEGVLKMKLDIYFYQPSPQTFLSPSPKFLLIHCNFSCSIYWQLFSDAGVIKDSMFSLEALLLVRHLSVLVLTMRHFIREICKTSRIKKINYKYDNPDKLSEHF